MSDAREMLRAFNEGASLDEIAERWGLAGPEAARVLVEHELRGLDEEIGERLDARETPGA